ncbi:MAG TPA: tRNA 4-thiouridine(8) synthase ThiI [Syntrophomonadaceae bacterium]|nr:tRNA 4-thiouridine(8) synthase ThiI [Syntrophomonadaceae bacterium]
MKAISLFSGGLDSQLAVCIIKEQGITVEAINFKSPFFGAEESTIKAATALNIKLHTIDLGNDYITAVLKNPVYGYGKNMNPCIDCHAFMFKKAGDLMQNLGAAFIVTGEVVGQRPMSQNKAALNAVNNLSGYKGYILRPLSAKLLPPTIPEIEGWVDRGKLEDISGRNRNRQIELAKKFNIIEYPSPAGGCLLTDSSFSNRLKKMLAIWPDSKPADMEILRFGRHIYLENNLLIVGRNKLENEAIEAVAIEEDLLFKVVDRPGPTGLLRNHDKTNKELIDTVGSIVARYSDAKADPLANVKVYNKFGTTILTTKVQPIAADQVPLIV